MTLVVGVGSVSIDLTAGANSDTPDLTAALVIVAVAALAAVTVVLAWPRLRHRLTDRMGPGSDRPDPRRTCCGPRRGSPSSSSAI